MARLNTAQRYNTPESRPSADRMLAKYRLPIETQLMSGLYYVTPSDYPKVMLTL